MKKLFSNADKDIRERELETGYITYKTLSELLGGKVLNNHIPLIYYNQLELINGDQYTYFDESYCETNEKTDNYELKEIYQYFVITPRAADILKEYTNELVFYVDEIGVYLWGVTHWGTNWSYVYTNIKVIDE